MSYHTYYFGENVPYVRDVSSEVCNVWGSCFTGKLAPAYNSLMDFLCLSPFSSSACHSFPSSEAWDLSGSEAWDLSGSVSCTRTCSPRDAKNIPPCIRYICLQREIQYHDMMHVGSPMKVINIEINH
jgi:hypothetical protein